VFIDKILGFTHKPQDAAVPGIALTQDDQLVLSWRNRTTQSTGVSVRASTFNPSTGKTRTFRALGPFASAGTVFGGETIQLSTVGLFSDGELLTSVTVTSDNITDPTQLWTAVFLFRQGGVVSWLCEGYVYAEHLPSWSTGFQTRAQFAKADPSTQGALYTFQGTVVNGAGGAGNQSYTIAPATGGRFKIIGWRLLNGDTAGRTATVQILDGVAGNLVLELETAVTLGAGSATNYPYSNTLGTGDTPAGSDSIEVAGGNVFVATLAAVAASQDSAFGAILAVWGGAPTVTLAGASTPTLTTNTSRFETG